MVVEQRLRRGLRNRTGRDHRARRSRVGRRGDVELAVPPRPRSDGVHRRSENPSLVEAPRVVLVPEGSPGAGGTILLLQKWAHEASAWEALAVDEQEHVIGRTKADSVELEDKPATSHVASTDQDRFGDIFRRNMPYGTVTDHGTMFVGFASERQPLQAMLESMAGLATGERDALTNYTRALTGAFYFVPSIESLLKVSGQQLD
jgi:porphyrinogen peroxidase